MPQCFIRIIKQPIGEAPTEVRNSWIGLILPVIDKKEGPTLGVITGKIQNMRGYSVAWYEAMSILEKHHPQSAKWWKENDFVKRVLVFNEECCEIVPD